MKHASIITAKAMNSANAFLNDVWADAFIDPPVTSLRILPIG
jgi:hypothetical protein